MYTIWFAPHGVSGAISTQVNTDGGMGAAQHVWDLLALNFRMLSARP